MSSESRYDLTVSELCECCKDKCATHVVMVTVHVSSCHSEVSEKSSKYLCNVNSLSGKARHDIYHL